MTRFELTETTSVVPDRVIINQGHLSCEGLIPLCTTTAFRKPRNLPKVTAPVPLPRMPHFIRVRVSNLNTDLLDS
jgi:hypothetical protein